MNQPSESGQSALHVQHLTCANNAAFVMSFEIERLDGDQVAGRAGGSGNFPINQTRSIDLAGLLFDGRPLQVGDRVRVRVHAVLGRTQSGPAVVYAPSGHTATFSVQGTTQNYSINRV